jgi:hypothetical protein
VCPCGDAFLLGVVFDVRLMSDTLLYFCDAIIFFFFLFFFYEFSFTNFAYNSYSLSLFKKISKF